MNNMGSSVIVGIASTKLLGILVLAFAPSTLFKLYYFRMYLFIIILGVFNGLYKHSDNANTILTVLTKLNIAADAVPRWSSLSTDLAVRPCR